jgi:hypothetical protein
MDSWNNSSSKGPNTYLVRVPGNNKRFVHADHLVHDDRESSIKPNVPNAAVETPVKVPPYVIQAPTCSGIKGSDQSGDESGNTHVEKCSEIKPLESARVQGTDVNIPPSPQPLRRSKRVTKPVVILDM